MLGGGAFGEEQGAHALGLDELTYLVEGLLAACRGDLGAHQLRHALPLGKGVVDRVGPGACRRRLGDSHDGRRFEIGFAVGMSGSRDGHGSHGGDYECNFVLQVHG